MLKRGVGKVRFVVLLVAIGVAAAWCAAAMAQHGGSIQGTVKNHWVSRFPVVVYIEAVPGRTFTPPGTHPEIDQRGKTFTPRVLPVEVGTTVDFLNSDPFDHNVYSPDNERYNLGTWARGKARSHTFKTAGVYTQLCKVHPEMVAYVVVLKNPYFAVTDAQGSFTIRNVPPGSYELKVWGERLRPNQLQKRFPVKMAAANNVRVELEP